KNLDAILLEAGTGLGMLSRESIFLVVLPLSVPVTMFGVRLATVYLIGCVTLASCIGAGGLGDYIVSGLSLYQTEFIIAGAIPVTILALFTDLFLGKVEEWVTPNGLNGVNKAKS